MNVRSAKEVITVHLAMKQNYIRDSTCVISIRFFRRASGAAAITRRSV